MTRLCLTLTKKRLAENLQDLQTNKPDLAELRLDLLSPDEQKKAAAFPVQSPVPIILTCRLSRDGGAWKGCRTEREALLLEALEGNFAYVDLEKDEDSALLAAKAARQGTKIIRSLHNFNAVPANLEARLEEMALAGNMVKGAFMCRGCSDLLKIFEQAASWKKKHPLGPELILLGMGPFGLPSRILAGKMGLYLTFCSCEGEEAAPGHISLGTLRNLYRAGELGKNSQVFGIIGNPVLHSRSPEIHNPAFRSLQMDAVYLPFPVDDVKAFFKVAEFLKIRGFSVTVPFKEKVRSFLVKESPEVQSTGACNTVLGKAGASWQGFNTDIQGFLEPLTRILKAGETLKDMKTAVIGAGGASRAVTGALVQSGCSVTVFNRSPQRAQALAEHFSCSWAPLETLGTSGKKSFDLVVQTTSCGMKGKEDPVPAYQFSGREILYDIIYSPPETPLMHRAFAAGCRVLGGLPMLKAQGQAQFQLFAGKNK